MLTTILIALAAAMACVLVYAAFRPDTFQLERSTVIAAPAERAFGLINDLKGFNSWNPFARQDPDLKLTYDAITQGVGAAYDWEGRKSGIGRMQITESLPSERVVMSLEFSKPMAARNTVVFLLVPHGAGTQVTWRMSGAMPYLHRLMGVFFSMDKMVGSQFEAGLSSLKSLAEKP